MRSVPRMGNRADDLTIRLDQKPDFDFVSITFGCQERLYLSNFRLVVPIFFSSLVSRKLQGRSCGGKLAPCALLVKTEPACSKPPAGVFLRVSTGERYDLSDASPFSIRTSSLQGRAGGSTFMAKLAEVFGPRLEPFVQVQLSPCIACTAVEAPSVRSRVLVFAGPSSSKARRDYRSSCSRLAVR